MTRGERNGLLWVKDTICKRSFTGQGSTLYVYTRACSLPLASIAEDGEPRPQLAPISPGAELSVSRFNNC